MDRKYVPSVASALIIGVLFGIYVAEPLKTTFGGKTLRLVDKNEVNKDAAGSPDKTVTTAGPTPTDAKTTPQPQPAPKPSQVIPTELEAREKLPAAASAAELSTDIKSVKRAVESLPPSWPAGILVVTYYDYRYWPNKAVPKQDFWLIIKTQGGILYNTWGAANIHTLKSFSEVKGFIHVASDGSTMGTQIWRGDKVWSRNDIWQDDFWKVPENVDKIQALQK